MISSKSLEKMDKSLLIKFLSLNSQSKLIFDLAKSKHEFTVDQIDEIINYKVLQPDINTPETVVFELFINKSFFEVQQAMANPPREFKSALKMIGKKLMRKEIRQDPITEQKFISGIEKEIHKWYTNEFYGEILEDDGKELQVKTQ